MIFKIKCLISAIKMSVLEWKDVCWDVDLNETVCCSGLSGDGIPCGCEGVTHKTQLDWRYFGLWNT